MNVKKHLKNIQKIADTKISDLEGIEKITVDQLSLLVTAQEVSREVIELYNKIPTGLKLISEIAERDGCSVQYIYKSDRYEKVKINGKTYAKRV